MRAYAVIGANYGDEGKGLMTDYLCARKGAEVVIRFNGGAQAGHTVVCPGGPRHVFSHFGSGTFLGVPTHLGPEFVVNPILYRGEFLKLSIHGKLFVTCDPRCPVTTPVEMLLNQSIEDQRGNTRHGSCGVGFNETLVREDRGYYLRVKDLFRPKAELRGRLRRITDFYLPKRIAELGLNQLKAAHMLFSHIEDFLDCVDVFKASAAMAETREHRGKVAIFEGAQGLLLDRNNLAHFPHLTNSNTGLQNVIPLAKELGIRDLEAVYVTRSYITRHGAGPFDHEHMDPVEDETNLPHPYQGTLRFGKLDREGLERRMTEDMRHAYGSLLELHPRLAVTHCDQVPYEEEYNRTKPQYLSYGPTRDSVQELP